MVFYAVWHDLRRGCCISFFGMHGEKEKMGEEIQGYKELEAV